MNDQQLDKKVRKDAAKVKRDFNILAEDTAVRLTRFENRANQFAGKASGELTTKVEDSVSQLSKGFEKLTGDTRDSVVGAAAKVKKDVGHRLNQYNAKAMKVLHKDSDAAARKAAIYTWIAVTLALSIGFLTGFLLIRPVRQPLG